jgi:hypothetical protein
VDGKLSRAIDGRPAEASVPGASLRATAEGSGSSSTLASLPIRGTFALAAGGEKAGLQASFGEVKATVAKCSVEEGQFALEAGGPLKMAAKLKFENAAAEHKGLDLSLSGISGDVPLSLNAEAGAMGDPPSHGLRRASSGRWSVGAVRFREVNLPAASGTLRLADWKADFTAAWPFLKGAVLNLEGVLDASAGRPLPAMGTLRGELRASIPRFEVGKDNQPQMLKALTQGVTLWGMFSLDGRVQLIGDRVLPLVRLKVENAQLESIGYDAEAKGINAEIAITSFTPLSTLGNQQIKVATARLGKLTVRDGFVAFRIEDPRSLFIEQTRWGWAGGYLYTHALRLDPQGKLDVMVFADHLNLKEILPLLPEVQARGDGYVYGRIEVGVRWPELIIGEGFLYATPGKKGVMELGDVKPIDDLLTQQYPAFTTDRVLALVKRRLVQALQSFEYSVLTADFTKEKQEGQEPKEGQESQLVARIHLQGKGRVGKDPQEIGGLDLEIYGFDNLIQNAIIIKRSLENPGLP